MFYLKRAKRINETIREILYVDVINIATLVRYYNFNMSVILEALIVILEYQEYLVFNIKSINCQPWAVGELEM